MLEEEIKQQNEENIKRNLKIVRKYNKVIHTLVIVSKILIIIKQI